MRCYRGLLNITNKEHLTNEEVRNKIQNAIGNHDDEGQTQISGQIYRASGMAKGKETRLLQGKENLRGKNERKKMKAVGRQHK